jgi:hypothetical protein
MYKGMQHPAIPSFLRDQILKVAIGQDFGGSKFFGRQERAKCHRCKEWDSCKHKYGGCKEVGKLLRLVLGAWERMTGKKLDSKDPWVTRCGVRHHTWMDATEAAQHGTCAREEVFRVIHAATLGAIHEESKKRGTPGTQIRCTKK